MNSSASRTCARSAGPPRQTRTASGELVPVANASLATTPMPARPHVPNERRPRPRRRQRQPQMKPGWIGPEFRPAQDRARQRLAFPQLHPHRRQQRIAGSIIDPSRRQRHRDGRCHHRRRPQGRRKTPSRTIVRHDDVGDPQTSPETFRQAGDVPGQFRRQRSKSRRRVFGQQPVRIILDDRDAEPPGDRGECQPTRLADRVRRRVQQRRD